MLVWSSSPSHHHHHIHGAKLVSSESRSLEPLETIGRRVTQKT
jgi:hypothetical protein